MKSARGDRSWPTRSSSSLLCALILLTVFQIPALSGQSAPVIELYSGPSESTYRSELYAVEVQSGMSWLSSFVDSYGRLDEANKGAYFDVNSFVSNLSFALR